MQLIRRGEINTLVFTVTERLTLTTPYYLFRFTSDGNRTQKLCLAPNISVSPLRYDEFEITESATEMPSSGVVSLPTPGFWTYEIFEVATATLDVQQAVTLLEKGTIRVIDDPATNYTAPNGGTTYISPGG